MKSFFVIEKIIGEFVVIENLENGNIITVNKSDIVGECTESNVLIKTYNNYVYSYEETVKRTKYIKDLANSLWNWWRI